MNIIEGAIKKITKTLTSLIGMDKDQFNNYLINLNVILKGGLQELHKEDPTPEEYQRIQKLITDLIIEIDTLKENNKLTIKQK